MTVAHYLRGYDRRTGRLGVEFAIVPTLLAAVRRALPDASDDPGLIDPYELTHCQTVRLAGLLDFEVYLGRFDYFVEAEEDWHVVAAIRDSLCAKA